MNIKLLTMVLLVFLIAVFGVIFGTCRGLRQRAYNERGLQLIKEGKYRKAVLYLRKAVQRDPGYVPAYNNLGIAYGRSGELSAAADSFRKAIRSDPDFAEAHFNLGKVLEAMHDYEGALRSYEKAEELKKNYVKARHARAHALYLLGREAIRAGKEQLAESRFLEAISIDPGLAKAHYAMARLHMKNGRYKEAVEDLNLVTQLEPGIELAPVLAEAYGKMGDWYKDQEKLQEAVSAYNRAANLQPANGAIHYKLGISLLALGRTGDAEKVLERASALQADITPEKGAAETFRSKARHLLTDGKTADAAQCLLLAELIDPSIDVSRARAELFQQQGKQLWDDGKKRKALELYIKAKRMYETLPGLDEDMARAMGEVGDRREAIALYEKLLARNPGDREWLESVGKLYMQSGDYKSALEKFSLLGEHGDTMVVKMLLNLAADAEDAGDWQRASQLYEEALERRPEDVELKLKYYSAMSARGRYDTAVEGMKELLKKYPEPRRPTFILLSIRKLENVRPGENLESSNGHHTWSFSPLWEGGVSLGKFTINRGKPVFSQGSVSRWERPSATRISYSGPDPIHDPFSLILTYDGGKEVEIFFPQIGSSKSLFADTEGNTYYDGSLADIARTAFPREIPPYLTIHYRMGMMYSAAGKRDESLQFARYHCKWGEAYLRLGMYRNSEIELKRALEIRPDLFEGYMGLGNLYSREGRYGEELKAMEKAVGMKPEDPVALNNLGVAYADTGQYKMAEREFLKSIDEDVNYLIAYWNLVKLYELQGREADKRFWMKQARKPRRVDPCEEGMTIKR